MKTKNDERTEPLATATGSIDKTKQPDPLAELRLENERLKGELRMRSAKEHLTGKLKKAGARDAKLLFEAAKDALKFTAEGLLDNAGELVDDLQGKYPEQFGHETSAHPHISIDGGAGARPRPAITKEALSKMKPSEIAELDWNEVKQALGRS